MSRLKLKILFASLLFFLGCGISSSKYERDIDRKLKDPTLSDEEHRAIQQYKDNYEKQKGILIQID